MIHHIYTRNEKTTMEAMYIDDIEKFLLETDFSNIDILRVYQIPINYKNILRPFHTVHLYLSEPLDLIFKGFKSSYRNEINRNIKNDNVEYEWIEKPTLQELETLLYDLERFSEFKGYTVNRQLELDRIRGLHKYMIMSHVKHQGQTLATHLYWMDGTKRARLRFSISYRMEEGMDPKLVARSNKGLHWFDIQKLKEMNVEMYDFGGAIRIDKDRNILGGGISGFKSGFTKNLVTEYNGEIPLQNDKSSHSDLADSDETASKKEIHKKNNLNINDKAIKQQSKVTPKQLAKDISSKIGLYNETRQIYVFFKAISSKKWHIKKVLKKPLIKPRNYLRKKLVTDKWLRDKIIALYGKENNEALLQTIESKYFNEASRKAMQDEILELVDKKFFDASAKKQQEIAKGSKIGRGTWINKRAQLEVPVALMQYVDIRSKVKLGRFTFINTRTTVFYNTKIGRYCNIGKQCEIGTVDHPIDWLSTSPIQYNIGGEYSAQHYDKGFQGRTFEQVEGCTIGNDVWIGSLSIIKSGVTIGDGAIVAAHSMVTKDVPPYAIVGGVPARIIRYRFDEETIEELLKLRWWDMDLNDFSGIEFDDVHKAIEELKKRKKSKKNR